MKRILITLTLVCVLLKLNGMNDRVPKEQWYLHNKSYSIQEMWSLPSDKKANSDIVVAVIDAGISENLPSITDSFWRNEGEIPFNNKDDDDNGFIDDVRGWNFVSNNGHFGEYKYSFNELEHGTRVAEIIGACHNRSFVWGIAANKRIKIMPLKVASVDDFGNLVSSEELLIKAIQYAEKMGAQICNISLNSDKKHTGIERIMKQSKMLFVVSAGNRSQNNNLNENPSFPASYRMKNLITVGNITALGTLNKNSNYGPGIVDIAAPGTDIWSESIAGEYTYQTGTSYAAPVITSVAALLYVCDGEMTAEECKMLICTSATNNEKLYGKITKGRVLNCKKLKSAFLERKNRGA